MMTHGSSVKRAKHMLIGVDVAMRHWCRDSCRQSGTYNATGQIWYPGS